MFNFLTSTILKDIWPSPFSESTLTKPWLFFIFCKNHTIITITLNRLYPCEVIRLIHIDLYTGQILTNQRYRNPNDPPGPRSQRATPRQTETNWLLGLRASSQASLFNCLQSILILIIIFPCNCYYPSLIYRQYPHYSGLSSLGSLCITLLDDHLPHHCNHQLFPKPIFI